MISVRPPFTPFQPQTNTPSRVEDKQVFPSLDFIGWYTATPLPTSKEIAIHEQLLAYTPNPILLCLHPGANDTASQQGILPFKAYEPTSEIR